MYTIRQMVEKYGKYVIWAVVIAFVAGGIVLFTPLSFNLNNSNNQANEVIAALVNGDKITEPKLDEEFQLVLNQQKQFYQQFGQNFEDQLRGANGAYTQLSLKHEALKQLIDDMLVEQERRKRRIDASGAEVEAKFKQSYQEILDYVKQQRGWDEKDLARELQARKDDIRDLKNRVRESGRDQLRKDKVKEAVVGKIEPTDQDLIKFIEDNRSRYEHEIIGDIKTSEAEEKAYFEQHKDKYAKTEYKTSHILIKVDKDAPAEKVEEARKKAEDIRQQALKPGADFAALAKQYSEDPGSKEKGGDLGNVDKDTPFVQEFKDALFKLEAGQISEPVKSQFGFHIIKALEKKQSSFEDMKAEVSKDLETERGDQIFKSWIEAAKANQAPEKVQLRQILIKVPATATPEQRAAAEKKANEAKTKLEKGDFAEVAKKYSEDEATKEEGGDLGLRETRSFPKEIQDAIASLKPGDKKADTSGVIKTNQGFVIVKLEERKTWEDIKKEIKDDHISEQKGKKFDDWLAKQRGAAKIEVKDQLLQAIGLEKDGKTDEALKLYEQLAKEGSSSDALSSYLPYYVAKIYQNKLTQAQKKKDALSNQDVDWKKISDQIELSSLTARIETLSAQPDKVKPAIAAKLKEIISQTKDRLTKEGKEKENEIKKDFVAKVQDAYKGQDEDLKKLAGVIREAELQPLEGQVKEYTQKSLEYLTKTAESGTGDEKLYETILGLDDENPVVHYKYGFWLYGEGKVTDAMKQVKRALELKPDLTDALVLYGDLIASNRNYATASEYYERALPLMNKQLDEAKKKRAALGNQDSNKREITQLDNQISELNSNLLQLEEKLADAYFGIEKWGQARDFYNKLAQAKPDKMKYTAALGDVAFAQNDFVTAEKHYKEAFDKEPTNYNYKVKLAKAYAQEHKTDQAIDLFKKVTADSPYFAEAWLGLGEAYQTKSDKVNALKAYQEGFSRTADKQMLEKLGERVLELKPDDVDTRLKLAKLYGDQHIFELAIQHYDAVLKGTSTAEQKLTAYLGLGDSAAGRADYAKAHEFYMSALKIASDDDKKVQVYEKIVDNEPKVVGTDKPFSPDGKEALFQLGSIYKKSNRGSKAKDALEKLQKLDANYKTADVDKMLAEIAGKKKEPTNALGPDKKPGQPVEEQKAEHIAQGAKHSNYNSIPPTSGPHYEVAAPWKGVYKEPIENERQVHDLEHGGVLLQYKPELDAETVKKIEDFVTNLRKDAKYCKVIAAPYPGLDTKLALTAWKRIDKFNDWDPDRVKAFLDAWLEQGPEKGIACP